MKAAEGGHAPVATLLLADERLNPNMTSVGSFTALIIAASKGHAPVVALLAADERVNPNVID